MSRITQISALTLIAASWLAAVGCSSSNDPSTGGTGATGNTGNTAGTGNVGNTTGSAGTGVVAQGGGGASSTGSAGSTSIAGTSSSTGGTASGTAGATAGGSTGTAGSGTGTAGSGAAGGSGMFSPLCAALTTAAGAAPTKGGACTAADPQLCYKTCGPQSVGFKSETCTAGVYAEQSGCTYPADLDASCYKIPAMIDASCPATAPQASQPCSVAACTLCNVGGNYLDSTGASKAGYCVCPAPGASGTSKWSCASTTAWPCPNGKGC